MADLPDRPAHAVELQSLNGISLNGISLALTLHQTSRFAMDRYIHEQNLAHYRKVLSETNNPATRQTVKKLLTDEQATTQVPTETKYSISRNREDE